MRIGWNLTRRADQLRNADVIVVSPGKAGRTWLRVLVNKYLSLHFGVQFSIRNLHECNAVIPSITYKHWLWTHFRSASWSARLLGKFIIPDGILFDKKILVLLRDPRDVVVSGYFHSTTRATRRIDISLPEYIRHPRFGISNLVRIMNIVHDKLRGHPQCLTIKYEFLRTNTAVVLEQILAFIGISPINQAFVSQAVDFASLENMQRMERNGEFDRRILRPGDVNDPNSFKVRKGKVGGYAQHFNEVDLAYLEAAIASLNPAYGYQIPSQSRTYTVKG
jgi:hypothetical protein